MPKKNFAALLMVVSAMLLTTLPVCAQNSAQKVPGAGAQPSSASDQEIQMLRQDIQGQRKQITAANMPLTPDEATKFWPLYDSTVTKPARTATSAGRSSRIMPRTTRP